MQASNESEKRETQDVMHFAPVPIKVVNAHQAIRLLEDPDYYIIIEVLRKGPMTIREIENAYNKRAAEHETAESRSYNTIYRYLKALEKAELVTPAGKRIEFGKTASETLFSRTARLFHYGYVPEISPEAVEFTKQVLAVLKMVYKGTEESDECLHETIMEFTRAMTIEITRLVEADDKGELDSLMKGDWGRIHKTVDYISFLGVLMNHPGLRKKLKNCLKEE